MRAEWKRAVCVTKSKVKTTRTKIQREAIKWYGGAMSARKSAVSDGLGDLATFSS
jgi:hypothetical protein